MLPPAPCNLNCHKVFPLLSNQYTIPKQDLNPPRQNEVHASASNSKPPWLGSCYSCCQNFWHFMNFKRDWSPVSLFNSQFQNKTFTTDIYTLWTYSDYFSGEGYISNKPGPGLKMHHKNIGKILMLNFSVTNWVTISTQH